MSTVLFVFFVVIFGVLAFSLKKEQIDHWKIEILGSLEANIKGGCNWTFHDSRHDEKANVSDFNIFLSLPPRREIVYFKRLPLTLTRSNPELINISVRRGYQQWAADTSERWQIPSDHPGQNRRLCYETTINTSVLSNPPLSIYDVYRNNIDRAFYLAIVQNAFIHPTGFVATACGYYQGKEGCETRDDRIAQKWWLNCNGQLSRAGAQFKDLWNSKIGILCTENAEPPRILDRVFVITARWDFNFGHFLTDSLARMVRYNGFLVKNPDIFIHIRLYREGRTDILLDDNSMRMQLLGLLGIKSTRIVNGPVLARKVFLPRHVRCQFVLSNPLEMHLLAQRLIQSAKKSRKVAPPSADSHIEPRGLREYKAPLESESSLRHASAPLHPQSRASKSNHWDVETSTNKIVHSTTRSDRRRLAVRKRPSKSKRKSTEAGERAKKIIILQRYIEQEPLGGAKEALGQPQARMWGNATFDRVVRAFAAAFSNHSVQRKSSLTLIRPLGGHSVAADILDFGDADVLVGAHGAGLNNMLFMPRGSLVVEITGQLQDVSMPLCGYFGPLAAVCGHHHYLYVYDWLENGHASFDAMHAAESALAFYREINSIGTMHSIAKNDDDGQNLLN